MRKVFSDSFLGLTGESESLTVRHPPTKLSDHLHLFFIHVRHMHGHQETQDLNQVPLCASAMRHCVAVGLAGFPPRTHERLGGSHSHCQES